MSELSQALENCNYHHATDIYADRGWALVDENIDAACFYLSFAYVYALEAKHPDLKKLERFLKKHGRV